MKAGNSGVIARILRQGQVTTQQDRVAQSLRTIYYDENAAELLGLVRTRIEIRKGYIRLGALGIFLIIYIGNVLLQQNVAESFSVESR